MGSVLDSGAAVDRSMKLLKTKCKSKKSKNGKHKWKRHGLWPSQWDECKHCGLHLYYK